VGVIDYRDVLYIRASADKRPVSAYMKNVRVVPGTMSAFALLGTLKDEQSGFAVIANESGGFEGIVSRDDILNAVFGHIHTEYDFRELPPSDRITILSQNEFLVPGDIKLSDVNALFLLSLESDNFDTLAGWLLERFDGIPSPGDAIKAAGCFFVIEDLAARRIVTVRLKK
jgi:putative hemolysin